jgi:hypothetical protein
VAGDRKTGDERFDHEAEGLQERLETKREAFVRQVMKRREGISAEEEGFLHGLRTGSHKVPNPKRNA